MFVICWQLHGWLLTHRLLQKAPYMPALRLAGSLQLLTMCSCPRVPVDMQAGAPS